MSCGKPFNIDQLKSPELMNLFSKTARYINKIDIQIVPDQTHGLTREETPAHNIIDDSGDPTALIQFSNSLSRSEQIQAIAHEIAHLLLMYKHELRIRDRSFAILGFDPSEIVNITHHLIFTELLKEVYKIESSLHLNLLRKNILEFLTDENSPQYMKGLSAYEYERLVGKIEGVGNLNPLVEDAIASAHKYFCNYNSKSIPTSPSYVNDIWSFLKDTGVIMKGGNSASKAES